MEHLKVTEGTKLIMKFCGWELTDSEVHRGYFNPPVELRSKHQPMNPSSAKYHSSWDWQIPVWSKVAKQAKELASVKDRQDNEEYYVRRYFKLMDKYENAIYNNDVEAGFQITIEVLKWVENVGAGKE